jgi:polyhydroxyalkanoate synthesis regulator phasin
MTLTDMETQANNLIQELQIKSNDIKRLTERIDYLERDLQQVEKSINEFCFK